MRSGWSEHASILVEYHLCAHFVAFGCKFALSIAGVVVVEMVSSESS